MVRKMMTLIALIVMASLIVAISGCTQPTATPTPAPTQAASPSPSAGPAALTISGKVNHSLSLSLADLKKYENKTITVPGKDNVSVTYTGVSYNKLLDDAGPASDATSVNMTGADGYSSALNLTDIRSSTDAIIAINADNTLKAVIPNQSKGSWVGNLTTIVIK